MIKSEKKQKKNLRVAIARHTQSVSSAHAASLRRAIPPLLPSPGACLSASPPLLGENTCSFFCPLSITSQPLDDISSPHAIAIRQSIVIFSRVTKVDDSPRGRYTRDTHNLEDAAGGRADFRNHGNNPLQRPVLHIIVIVNFVPTGHKASIHCHALIYTTFSSQGHGFMLAY
jgi:hypothetical protein